jgi:hypothetical protein
MLGLPYFKRGRGFTPPPTLMNHGPMGVCAYSKPWEKRIVGTPYGYIDLWDNK